MNVYRKFFVTALLPYLNGWYDTDKGLLFYYVKENVWSCREDRISEEYPTVWYCKLEV